MQQNTCIIRKRIKRIGTASQKLKKIKYLLRKATQQWDLKLYKVAYNLYDFTFLTANIFESGPMPTP
jgi:hypothetical protein